MPSRSEPVEDSRPPSPSPAAQSAVPRAPLLVYLSLQATIEGQASHAHVHEIIGGLKRRGWRIRLFEPGYATASKAPGPLARLVEFVAVQVRMLRLMLGADVIYIRWHFATIIAALAARLMGKTTVQEVNGNYEDVYAAWPAARRLRPLLVTVQRAQLRMASGIVAVTPQLSTWITRESGNSQVAVIPNAANAIMFHPEALSDLGFPKPYVAFVGAFAPWQGLATVLEAVEQADWPAGVGLLLVGRGQMAPLVDRAAQRNPLIWTTGALRYAQIPGVLACAEVALCMSSARASPASKGREANSGVLPLKLYEAMACGVAIIASDQDGQADVIRSTRCGIVIPPEQPGELARAVAWLWANPDERAAMGANGRRAVETGDSWDHRAADTDRFLRSLAGTGSFG